MQKRKDRRILGLDNKTKILIINIRYFAGLAFIYFLIDIFVNFDRTLKIILSFYFLFIYSAITYALNYDSINKFINKKLLLLLGETKNDKK